MQINKQTGPSNRSFGLFFFLVFSIISIYGNYANWSGITLIGLGWAAAIILLLSIVASPLLGPFNRLWMGLGYVLGTIVSPVILAVLYFGIITPFAFLLRLRGRDELKLKLEPTLLSYWIDRESEGPLPDTFKNQF